MIVEFDKSFLKSLDKIKDAVVCSKIENTIVEYEQVSSVLAIKQTKKLSGFRNYYRTRIGDYRLGFELISGTTIRLILCAHRKDIYKSFP